MRIGLLGSLLGVPGRRRRTLPSNKPGVQYPRLSLEVLESRALPSVLTVTLGPAAIVMPAPQAVQPVNTLLNSPGPDERSMADGQTDSQQDGQASVGNSVIQSQLHELVNLKLYPVSELTIQSGGPQQNPAQSPGGTDDPQGDAQDGQSDGDDNGSANLIDDSQGDPSVNQDSDNGQPGQSDSSDAGATDSSSQGDSSSTGSTNDCTHSHRTTNGSSDGQSDDQDTQVGPSQNAVAAQVSSTGQGMAAGQSTLTSQGSTAGQSSAILPSPSDGKTSSSLADSLAGNPELAPVADLSVGTIATASNQVSSSDKRQQGPSDASIALEAGQRGPASVQDGRQHSPDGTFTTADQVHGLLAVKNQGAEQFSRGQADGQNQQQNFADDPGQRLLAERLRLDTYRGPAIAATVTPPGEEAIFVHDLPDDTAWVMDYVSPSLQKHELLTDSLHLDFASLRTEVQRFFEHIDHLGVHATERQIGLVIYSAFVVVSAAMACEVAWRQARRPAVNPPLALASTLDLADDGESPAAAGLPHFGQFSALS